jgi:hypothetical protein
MSNNEPITLRGAAKVFLPLAGLFVVFFIMMALGGEAEPTRPAQNALGALYGAFRPWLVPSLITLVIVALLPILARHSARTADTPREGNALQAINAALIDERNQMEKRVKELERAEAMHHKAMLNLKQESEYRQESLFKQVRELKDTLIERQEEDTVPLDILQAIILMRYARSTPALTVRGARELIRAEGISLPDRAYAALSAFVKEANTLPHQQAQPVRDTATEKNSANARRERANGRTRTQRRTRKA